MAATTVARNTPQMADVQRAPLSHKMKGATTVLQGTLGVLNAGYAAPGATATGLVAAGRVLETKANPGADGAVSVEIEEGTFKWANDGADPVVAVDVGQD